jgi:protein-L-isoaspartate(D-aspartate) O-methyltransferase
MAVFRNTRGGDPSDLVRIARRSGVRDERVLAALGEVRRDLFVPEGDVGAAYADRPVRIPRGQTTSQPSLIAMMIEALELTGDERVLEVGTGYGYQTALLSHLAGEVWSIERHASLAEAARTNLDRAGIGNVHVVVGDGHEGLPDAAPFDGIVLSAATPEVPATLVDQLAEGGLLVVPIGPGGAEEVTVHRRTTDGLERVRRLTRARFVPMRRGKGD